MNYFEVSQRFLMRFAKASKDLWTFKVIVIIRELFLFFNSKKVQTVLANHDFKLETEVKKKRNLVKNG